MQKRSFEGIGVIIESCNQQAPDEKIQGDINQKDNNSNCIETAKTVRDWMILARIGICFEKARKYTLV